MIMAYNVLPHAHYSLSHYQLLVTFVMLAIVNFGQYWSSYQ